MVSYGDSVYVLGGWLYNKAETDSIERYTRDAGWKNMAKLPVKNKRSN